MNLLNGIKPVLNNGTIKFTLDKFNKKYYFKIGMQKKVLTEQALYYGDVAMPKDWDIDRNKLSGDILQSQIQNKQFPFSKTWDMLNTYVRDHIGLEYGISLINKETWGNIYKPAETTIPLLNIDPVDLRNSPDYTLLYGVKVENCMVRIYFEDNRRKGRSWDIELTNDILQSSFTNKQFPFSRTWDMLNTYMRDFIGLDYGINLVNKDSWGDIYKPGQVSKPLLNVDPVDLRNSPDFTMLYGVKVDKCWVRIHFDDNRRKGRSWDIELKKNMFVMFPSTNMYIVSNDQKDSLNFVQTITYEYI